MSPERAKVLIVEDERIIARDLRQSIEELGYLVTDAVDAADLALEAASRVCPDLVLMDIRIRGERDGIEAARLVRERFGVPEVFLTAHADDATLERAKRAEPAGYLVKPVNPAELRSTIEVSLYRHRLEARLRERERWFSTTLHSISDAVVAVDLQGRVTFMNDAAERLTGRPATTVLGHSAVEALRLEAPHIDTLASALVRREPARTAAAPLHRTDGEPRLVSDHTSPVLDERRPLGAVMVFRDVTEEHDLRRRVEMSDRLASLGTLAAGVAHEINNPLSAVLSNADVAVDDLRALAQSLATGVVGPEAHEVLDGTIESLLDVRVAAKRIARIVSDLKSFSRGPRLDEPGGDLERSVAFALRIAEPELKHLARTTVEVSGLPRVALDDTRLSQVLITLVVNAAHAMAHTPVSRNHLSIVARHHGADGLVELEVADTGHGMSPQVLKRVFEPFFTTKDVGVGTGLGLSVCHGLIAAVGGRLDVQSEEGRGTTFRLWLPVEAPRAPDAEPTTESRLQTPRAKIWVVDDEPAVLALFPRILKEHEVVTFSKSTLALARIQAGERFDLLLLDLMMPDLDGAALYERLVPFGPEVTQRVVFLTGGAVGARLESFMATIGAPVLAKPFDADALRRGVSAQLLERRPG